MSAEVSPYAKVGGLADVAGSLPKALHAIGHDIRIVMPLYSMIEKDPRWMLESIVENLPIPLNGHWVELAQVKQGSLDGVTVYFIGHERYFKQATSSDKIYTPGIDQYLFFSTAVLELAEALGWLPDIVHCNDWHTGFVPVLMREKKASGFDETGTVFTIHNLAYQGEFGTEILDALALPRSLFVPEYLETWGAVNFLKAGSVYSDQVNTVSPTYAEEIQTSEFGCKLQGLMSHLAEDDRLSGILNGIGTQHFDPASDPYLPENFSVANMKGKQVCRERLLREIGLDALPETPIVGAVTRLSSQKGLFLLAEAAPKLFDLPLQLVIQGLGDPAIITELRRLQNEYPNHIRFFEKFDEDLAQRIYGGCDMFAMPSLFEPCGLGQMIAMRYGTVPVVRKTGGLADTVFEPQNGFSFSDPSVEALVGAFERAVSVYRRPKAWSAIVRQGMTGDYGWETSAAAYEALYEKAQAGLSRRELKLA